MLEFKYLYLIGYECAMFINIEYNNMKIIAMYLYYKICINKHLMPAADLKI